MAAPRERQRGLLLVARCLPACRSLTLPVSLSLPSVAHLFAPCLTFLPLSLLRSFAVSPNLIISLMTNLSIASSSITNSRDRPAFPGRVPVSSVWQALPRTPFNDLTAGAHYQHPQCRGAHYTQFCPGDFALDSALLQAVLHVWLTGGRPVQPCLCKMQSDMRE